MRDFSKAKMYLLTDGEQSYVGSTCCDLRKRRSLHKSAATRLAQTPVYAHFNDIGWDRARMVLLEEHPCGSYQEQRARERFWYDALRPTLNVLRPLMTREEALEGGRVRGARYRARHPERVAESKRKYRAAQRAKPRA